jgi:hypothetical protein
LPAQFVDEIKEEMRAMKKENDESSKETPPQGEDQFMVSDAQQKAGEKSHENDGPFGIGMSKGK